MLPVDWLSWRKVAILVFTRKSESTLTPSAVFDRRIEAQLFGTMTWCLTIMFEKGILVESMKPFDERRDFSSPKKLRNEANRFPRRMLSNRRNLGRFSRDAAKAWRGR